MSQICHDDAATEKTVLAYVNESAWFSEGYEEEVV